jgi:5'-methylthioadenosine phosphorylase
MTEPIRIGIIGGSGLYRMKDLEVLTERVVATPFGEPSAPYVIGRLGSHTVAFLPRHGIGHTKLPTEINFRANVYGFKVLGVEWLISVSAVGSMKETIRPGMMVIPDQFFDRTYLRARTFFGEGLVAHVSFAHPVCPELSIALYTAAQEVGVETQFGGTYLCIEGPQFSTKAESETYRTWNVDVIGMTNLPEAWLAREAEICYATIAMATDYDCWYEHAEPVTAEMVIRVLQENLEKAQRIIRKVMDFLPLRRQCPCASALQDAFITDPQYVPRAVLEKLWPIVGKYFGKKGVEGGQ